MTTIPVIASRYVEGAPDWQNQPGALKASKVKKQTEVFQRGKDAISK